MAAGVGNYRDLVRQAHDGSLKLPAFQRNWRWRSDKVIKLYDSLRLRYPIGSFLFLKGGGATLAPRPFNGSGTGAAEAETTVLVLDGQQRLTAGVHIFHATGQRQYFIDLNKLDVLVTEADLDLDDEVAVAAFCGRLDYEDGYLLSRQKSDDPRALLVSHDLLCTSIVTHATRSNLAARDYLKARPERTALLLQLVQPHFALSEIEAVPHIDIEEATSISAISRIFTTLNTTGQMLTPFELVVASLFPSNIDLQKEVADFREQGTFYPRMDATGEILLQTIAMLAEVDQKKSNLPKSITAANYTLHKQQAFDALEALGGFLTDSLGCGLNVSAALVPYDAIYAPMARALLHVKNKVMSGPELAEAHRKLKLWFAASSLSQRYQEGVHNKQGRDFREMVAWIDGAGEPPAWLGETRTPSLLNKSFDGAIGKFVQCCMNSRDPRDPVVTAHKVGFRAGVMPTEKHHIFPTKFVAHLTGWDKKVDKSDTLLNLMFVEQDTNKRWLNLDPINHAKEALKSVSEDELKAVYEAQFIDAAAVDLLLKPEKSRADFYEFLASRNGSIQAWIKGRFGIEPLDGPSNPHDVDHGLEEDLEV